MDLFQGECAAVDPDFPDGPLEDIVGMDVVSADMEFDMGRRQDKRRILFAGELPAVQGHFPDLAIPAHGDKIPGVFLQGIRLVRGNDMLLADPQLQLAG